MENQQVFFMTIVIRLNRAAPGGVVWTARDTGLWELYARGEKEQRKKSEICLSEAYNPQENPCRREKIIIA